MAQIINSSYKAFRAMYVNSENLNTTNTTAVSFPALKALQAQITYLWVVYLWVDYYLDYLLMG